MTEKPFRVVIVGGGIAGLGLAHGLLRLHTKRRIEVIVYEKRQDDSRFVQYPIHVAPDGRDGLRQLLSDDELAELKQLSDFGIEHGGITIVSQDLKRRFAMRQEEDERLHFVMRADLLRLLKKGVDIKRGVGVLKVVDDSRGRVRVLLDDGTEDEADLVVGADGIGSTVRAQLHPHLTRVPSLPCLTISFKLHASGKVPLADKHGINLVLGRCKYTLLLVPISNAFVYAVATVPVFDGWQSAQGWQRRLEDEWIGGTENVWQDACMDPRQAPTCIGGRTFLIGDAAHAMPPYGGVGASLALKDAAELCLALSDCYELSDVAPQEAVPRLTIHSLDGALENWHDAMMRRALSHLKDARRRMRLSLRSGFDVRSQRLVLWLMQVSWTVLVKCGLLSC